VSTEVTTEELDSLRESVRGFLARRSPSAEVRRLMDTEQGFDPVVWAELAEQLGLPALAIDEEYGGAGYGPVEQGVVLEEAGRALCCLPYFSTAVLAAQVLQQVADQAAKRDLLPGIASGLTRATAAFAERSWYQGLRHPETTALTGGGGTWVLNGHKTLVLDGHTADLLLVTAATRRGTSLFAVDATEVGVRRTVLPVLDLTRKQADVTMVNVRGRLVGIEGSVVDGLTRATDLALIGLAAEQVGGADRCLQMIVEYLKVRTQFGRLLGSFQALKHRCADLAVQVHSARALADAAAAAAANQDWPQVSVLASLAKATCSEVYAHASAENVQLHGGIGFTWEHDAHLHFKRARTAQYLFGEPSYHRERAAQGIGL
jgi:alkylation response protein AidB-like acyl-CoA dehydrogenase